MALGTFIFFFFFFFALPDGCILSFFITYSFLFWIPHKPRARCGRHSRCIGGMDIGAHARNTVPDSLSLETILCEENLPNRV